MLTPIQKVLRRVVQVNDCWEFPGWSQGRGYGCVARYVGKTTGRNGKRRSVYEALLAHRVAYEHFHGSIPDGMDVHHKCENKKCVNPNHLEVIPHHEHGPKFHPRKQETPSVQG